jgi:hypothetical protein
MSIRNPLGTINHVYFIFAKFDVSLRVEEKNYLFAKLYKAIIKEFKSNKVCFIRLYLRVL